MSAPTPGTRASKSPRSGIRVAAALAHQTPGAIRFDIGDPDFPTPAHVVGAVARVAAEGHTHYGPSIALPSLRVAIADDFARRAGGIAGVILVSEVSTAQWNANTGIEFDVITAIVLGGTSLLGAFFLMTIGDGFNLLGTSTEWQYLIKGVILAGAVPLGARARRARR